MEDLINVAEEIEDIEGINVVLNLNNEIYPHPKVYLQHKNPFQIYDEIEFRRNYRMHKDTARYIINLVRGNISPINGRGCPVSADLQVLATIRYLAEGAYEQDIANLHGFHQSTLSRVIKRVVRSIASHRNEYIKFPDTREALYLVKEEFFNIAGCPNIVGTIDGTHIKIKCPGGEYPLLYINRKGFYSLNVQVVGDANCRILDIVARWRGSVHDSRIWDASRIREKFENETINGILLGDNGYATSKFILTPLFNPQTDDENRYNSAHIKTCNSIERLFGYWKNKFRCFFNGLQLSLDMTKTSIIALAVIHNICFNLEKIDLINVDDPAEYDAVEVNQNAPDNLDDAIFRRNYINRYFQNN